MPSGISRKTFLKMLAVGAGQLVIPKAAMARANSRSVIIVGAGMAGLAANHELRSAGARTLLLEARARTGGRIRTNPDKLDLGACTDHQGRDLLPAPGQGMRPADGRKEKRKAGEHHQGSKTRGRGKDYYRSECGLPLLPGKTVLISSKAPVTAPRGSRIAWKEIHVCA